MHRPDEKADCPMREKRERASVPLTDEERRHSAPLNGSREFRLLRYRRSYPFSSYSQHQLRKRVEVPPLSQSLKIFSLYRNSDVFQ